MFSDLSLPSYEGCFDGKLWFLSLFTLLVSLILKYTTNKMETGLNWFWGDYADEQIISPWVFQFGKVALPLCNLKVYENTSVSACNFHILALLSQKPIQTTLDHTNTVFIIFFRNNFRNFQISFTEIFRWEFSNKNFRMVLMSFVSRFYYVILKYAFSYWHAFEVHIFISCISCDMLE